MKKGIKLVAMVLVLLMVLTVIGACQKKASGPVEVDFWIVGNYPDDWYYLGAVLEDFNKEFEGKIKVNITSMGADHSEDLKKWQMAAQSDTMPDMLEMNSYNTLNQFIEGGFLANMWDYLGQDKEFLDRFNEANLSAVTRDKHYGNGEFYAYPTETEIQGWYYNQALFDQAGAKIPETFDELLDAVAKLRAAGITPLVHGCTDNWDTWGYHAWGTRLGMTEEKWIELQEGKYKAADCAPIVGLLTYVDKLQEAGAYNEDCASMSNSQALEVFLGEQAAMYCVGSWKMQAMEESAIADKIRFNFGPEFDDGVLGGKSGVKPLSWCIAFGKHATDSKEKAEACATIAKWMVSPERAAIEATEYGHFPNCKVDTSKAELGPVGKLTAEAAAADVIPLMEFGGYFPTDFTGAGDWYLNTVTGIIAGTTTVEQGLADCDAMIAAYNASK